MKSTPRIINIFLLSAVMLAAIFFRFYRLDSVPPGLYPDVAVNGTNALQTLLNRDFKVFYPDNNGREGLIMWLDAISMLIFGVSVVALKIPAAIVGTLTVLGIYLLSRQMFEKNGNAIGLLAAFFCAASFWHVNFSRIGFRAIMVPFFIVFSLYFLWKALKPKANPAKALPLQARRGLASARFWFAILSGISFGLGFYTYISFRLAVPLLFCVLGLWLIVYWRDKMQFAKIAAAMLLATLITALPIGIYFLQNPADFMGRAAQTSILTAQNPLLALGQSIALHLGMFNFYGDQNWRHNYPPAPELFFPVGILFLIGLVLALKQSLLKSNFNRLACSSLLLWFCFLLLPGVLTSEGIPHALRTIGVIPAVMILSALGAVYFYEWLKPRLPKFVLAAVSFLFILAVAVGGYWQYFIAWAQNPNTPGAFTVQFVDFANLTIDLRNQDYRTIVIVNENGSPVPYPDGVPMPAQTVMFIQDIYCATRDRWFWCDPYGPYSTYLAADRLNELLDLRSSSGKSAVIPMKDDQAIFDKLKALYPQGQIKTQNNIKYYEINQ